MLEVICCVVADDVIVQLERIDDLLGQKQIPPCRNRNFVPVLLQLAHSLDCALKRHHFIIKQCSVDIKENEFFVLQIFAPLILTHF